MARTFRPAKARSHAHPEGSWGMAVDVPYPQVVQQNGLAFTRGQCALDEAGRVLRPHDLLGQTEIIVENLRDILVSTGVSTRQIVRAVAFYLNNGSIDEAEFRDHLAQALGTPGTVSIVPVPLEHFYYDGMMVEIDFAFAEDLAEPVKSERRCRPFADAVMADDLLYISQVTADKVDLTGDDLPAQLASVRDRLHTLLADAGGVLDDIVKLTTYYTGSSFDWARIAEARCQWFDRFLPVVSDVGLPRLGRVGAKLAVDAIAVRQASPNHWRREPINVSGYGRWPIDLTHPQAVRMGDLLFTGGQLAVSEANTVYAPYELDAQTPVVMDHLGRILEAGGMSFVDVIKATTYYRGGANAEDLHGNLAIRSGYYSAPGPASTGVPVTALPAAAAMISVEATAIK